MHPFLSTTATSLQRSLSSSPQCERCGEVGLYLSIYFCCEIKCGGEEFIKDLGNLLPIYDTYTPQVT